MKERTATGEILISKWAGESSLVTITATIADLLPGILVDSGSGDCVVVRLMFIEGDRVTVAIYDNVYHPTIGKLMLV